MAQNQIKPWRVTYFTSVNANPIKEFIDSLSFKQQVKVLRIFQYIQEYGLEAVKMHVKKLTGSQLWEIRILGSDNIRVFYVTQAEKYSVNSAWFYKEEAENSY